MATPLFSIITITYNARSTIAPTMSSVASQTCHDYEHLIVDGASKDDTCVIANDMSTERTHITSQPDHGIYDAMNRGIDRAKGSYLIFLNAGDTFHSTTTLETIKRSITDNNNPGIVYGQTDLVDSRRRYVGPRHLTAPANLSFKSFADGMVVCHQAMAVNKEIAGHYDTRYRFSADYEWVIRCLQQSTLNIYIDAVLIDYLDEGMTTRNLRASLRERYKIMCQYYGTLPTIARHLKFFTRGLIRRLSRGSKQ